MQQKLKIVILVGSFIHSHGMKWSAIDSNQAPIGIIINNATTMHAKEIESFFSKTSLVSSIFMRSH